MRRYGWISAEVRQTAVDLVRELLPVSGSVNAACQAVAKEMSVHPNTVRNWLDASAEPVVAADAAGRQRLAELEAINRKLIEALKDQGSLR